MTKSANAKLADKAFAADRAKCYGNSVKSLVERALERAKETSRICSGSSHPTVKETRVHAEGRRDALEAVLDAMNGNKAMLRH